MTDQASEVEGDSSSPSSLPPLILPSDIETALPTLTVIEMNSPSSPEPNQPSPPRVPERSYLKDWDRDGNGKLRPKVPPRPTFREKFESVVHVSIPGTSIKVDLHDKVQRPFATYYIQVECQNGCGWTVQRRFRELRRFALNIRKIKQSGIQNSKRFPSRFTRRPALSSVLIEYRRQTIETFIQSCIESTRRRSATENWRAVGQELMQLLSIEQNYCSHIDTVRRLRLLQGSFQVQSTPSGLLFNTNERTLRAQALMKHVLAGQPHIVQLPSEQSTRRRQLSAQLKSLSGQTPAECICLELSELVALQQAQVDRFATCMLSLYPSKLFISSLSLDTKHQEQPSSGGTSRSLVGHLFRRSGTYTMKNANDNRSEEFMQRVHRFLTRLSWKLVDGNPDTIIRGKNAGFDLEFCFDMSHRLFEAALLERHQEVAERLRLAALCCDNIAESDQNIQQKLDELQALYRGRGVPPALFGAKVHPQFNPGAPTKHQPGVDFAWGWEEAVLTINQLLEASWSLPSSQVEKIMECVSLIYKGIASAEDDQGTVFHTEKSFAKLDRETKIGNVNSDEEEEHNEDGSESEEKSSMSSDTESYTNPKALGADDLVPVFFYVLACSRLRQPCMMHKFMSSLASDSLLDTEAKYWLTVFESGLHFLGHAEL